MHDGNHIWPLAVNLAVDESLQIHGWAARCDWSSIEIELQHILFGDKCRRHASGEQKAIGLSRMTHTDMAETVDHALIEQNMICLYQFADR
jgi:hypothetical protein